MKRLSFFIILLLAPILTFPTCIIILRNHAGNVYIVADRMVHYTDGRSPTEECKLFGYKNCFYAIAGTNPELAKRVLDSAIDRNSYIPDAIKYFVDRYKFDYSVDIATHRKQLLIDKSTQEIGIVYFDGIATNAEAIAFTLRVNGQTFKILDSSFIASNNRPVLPLGVHDHLGVDKLEALALVQKDMDQPIKYCEDLIDLERSHHKDSISRDLDYFELTNDGTVKFLRDPKCPFIN